ncbi:hypothetical protein METP3_03456 [Methanosarcinales archaeon]|nr:hypothetical protein METP3_03456 [Methanosarcinales archaeon]
MKLLNSQSAEAEVVGHVIILSITILGISMITLFGIPAIYSLEDMANSKNVEQAFTILDSRASRVVLGDSPLQVTNINLGGGTMTVEPNSSNNPSYMVINSTSFNFTIPMGKIIYNLDDRIVAYEGGGVWAQYPGGGTVMLSPPEFHYNGWTLTLPVINVNGNASVGGKGTAVVSINKNKSDPIVIHYPNDNFGRANPVNTSDGKLYIKIRSDFYEAWAEYAKNLRYTKINTDPITHTADIELTVVPSNLGTLMQLGYPQTYRGINSSNETPMDSFNFNIVNDKIKWDIRAKSGSKTLIFQLINVNEGHPITLKIGYQDGDDTNTETWYRDELFNLDDVGFYKIDFLDKSKTLDYKAVEVGSNDGITCVDYGLMIHGIVEPDFSWDNLTINTSESNPNRTQSLHNITQHYFRKMAEEGDITFGDCNNGGLEPDPDESTMIIDYIPIGTLTYLQVTENKADVGIS